MPLVVKMVNGWSVDVSKDGTTGVRRYVTATAVPSATPVELPVPGDAWGTEFPGLVAQSVQSSLLGGDPNCGGYEYVVNYSTRPQDDADEDEYPMTVEVSSEVLSYSDSGDRQTARDTIQKGREADGLEFAPNRWIWPGGDLVGDNVRHQVRIPLATVVCHRTLRDADINDYLDASQSVVGTVNDAELFGGISPGMGLYVGSDVSEEGGDATRKSWHVTMRWAVRVSGAWGQGWNHAWRPAKAAFELIAPPLYETTSHAILFSIGESGPAAEPPEGPF